VGVGVGVGYDAGVAKPSTHGQQIAVQSAWGVVLIIATQVRTREERNGGHRRGAVGSEGSLRNAVGAERRRGRQRRGS